MSFPITVTARLGADPEIKPSANGSNVGKMRVVTNARRMVDGEWQDTDTSWWSVVTFGKTTDAIDGTLVKGDQVVIVGKIKMREWEQDGSKRTAPEIVADQVAKVVKVGQAQPQSSDWGQTDTAPF
jgi:single-strand DNA-binding protein